MKKLAQKIVIKQLKRQIVKLLKINNIKVVAITGSMGKTSAKIATAKMLSDKFKVIHSSDSYNTEIGLPLSFFGLKTPTPIWNVLKWQKIFYLINKQIKDYPYEVAVLEMGADKPGDIAFFTSFIKPDIGVVTSISSAHIEKFKNIDNIFKEKWLLAKASKKVIYNSDFKSLNLAGAKLKGATSYGLKSGNVTFENIVRQTDGYLKADLVIGDQRKKIVTKQISKQGLYSLLVAAAVSNIMGFNINQISKVIPNITATRGRMNLLKGVNHSLIIDDSYNSNPQAVVSAIDTLSEFNSRKIAVLGDMNELGDYSKKAHEEVGRYVSKKVDLLITIGDKSNKSLALSALNNGLAKSKIFCFKDPYSAGSFLSDHLEKNDIILVKGSQNGVYSEESIKAILNRKIKSEEVLVRQSADWLKKKRKAFK